MKPFIISVRAFTILINLFLVFLTHSWRQSVNMQTLEEIVMKSVCGNCSYNGQVCEKNLQYISGLSQSGHYDLSKHPIIKNSYGIGNMTFQSIYTTGYFQFPNKRQNGNRNISGLLAMPDTNSSIRGMVVYFHGTIFSKRQAPSIQNNPVYMGIASIFGAHNYAVLFPDYPGLGADSQNVHPYVLYPQQNVRSSIYLLNHAVHIINSKYIINDKIGMENPIPLMTTGFSEGAAYSIYFGACKTPNQRRKHFKYCNKNLQIDPAYQIVAIQGSAGAYDTNGAIKQFWFSQVKVSESHNPYKSVSQKAVNSIKPGLASIAMLSYATYNPDPFPFSSVLDQDFHKNICASTVDSPHCDINMALSVSKSNSGAIKTAVLQSALRSSNNGYSYVSNKLSLLFSASNSLYSLINLEIVNMNNLHSALKDSCIVNYGNYSPFPIFIFSLERDSFVSPINSEKFIKHNRSGNVYGYFMNNSHFLECVDGQTTEIDHTGVYVVSHFFVLQFFESMMRQRSEITAKILANYDQL